MRALASLALLWALVGCGTKAVEGHKKPVPVRVRLVEKRTGDVDTRYSGTLEPAVKVDLAFRVSGYVDTIGEFRAPDGKTRPLEKGDWVQKGTVLARVRTSDYAQKLAAARAAVAQARAAAKLAEQDLERAKKLFEANAIPKADFDSVQAKSDNARATVDNAVATANQAAIALADCVLSAPTDGVVLSRSVEVGTLVSPGSPAFTLADTRSVKALFGAPQSLVEKLHVGSAVQVYLGVEAEATGVEKMIAAQVTRIAPSAESSGRVFAVEVSLPNPDGSLRPGSVVSIHIPDVAFANQTMVVPLSAVVRSAKNPRGFAVFVLDGDGDRAPARLRDVRLGDVLGNAVSVVEGLSLGQRVVTVGATLLHDGDEAVVIR